MLGVACGETLDDNFKYDIYYDPADRKHSPCKYLGIYKNKRIQGVGKIINIVTANKTSDGGLEIINPTKPVTEEQKQRILGIIESSLKNTQWDIRKGEKFWIVDQFYRTNFKKNSPGGLLGKKYFNLKKYIPGLSEKMNAQTIADHLSEQVWDIEQTVVTK